MILFSKLGVVQRGEKKGYPANTVLIVDAAGKVRYTSVLEPTVAHCPQAVLRTVAKLQATDDGAHLVMSGSCLAKTLVDNTPEAIKDYYCATYGGFVNRMLSGQRKQPPTAAAAAPPLHRSDGGQAEAAVCVTSGDGGQKEIKNTEKDLAAEDDSAKPESDNNVVKQTVAAS